MRYLILALLGGGCGFSPGGGAPLGDDVDPGPDAGAVGTDAAVSTIDAGPDASQQRLGLNQPCDPTVSQVCIEGYTCRPRYDDGSLCRPVGVLPAGAACTPEGDECAFNLACVEGEGPVPGGWCRVVCDVGAPDAEAACAATAGAGTTCEAWWSPAVGWCR